MADWQEVKLGDVTKNFDSFRVPVKGAERRAGPYPYYGASGIVDYVDQYIFDGEYLLIAEDGENLRTRNTPIAFIANGKFWVNNHAHIVQANEKAITKYLEYCFSSLDISGYITGSTIPKLSQRSLKDIKVILPPLPEQQAIAEVLSALDEKIELNRRMNATLEAMARALFKSWFVDFIPVRAKMEGRAPDGLSADIAALFPDTLVDSPLGEIPKGWRSGCFGEIAENFDSKRVPLSNRQREQRRGIYPYHGATSVMDYVDDYLFEGTHVLVGEDGSVCREDGTPYTQYVWGKIWVNNHAHVLKGKNSVSDEHLYLFISQTNISGFVTGAVQPKLNQKNMNSIPAIIAPESINKAFALVAEPIFSKVRILAEENQTLSQLRDTLLPKLISGQLRVTDATSSIKEAV